MKVHVLIPCVGSPYSEYLDEALSHWLPSAASVTVVTSAQDDRTALVASKHGCLLHTTEIWWANGAVFGKAQAMEEARTRTMPAGDWRLMADADVIPGLSWLADVESHKPEIGKLYGAIRRLDDGSLKSEGEVAGFFMLHHHDDPNSKAPLGVWRHAGSYDSAYQMRWGKNKVILPIVLRHYGAHGRHWCGYGNDAAMDAMRQERKRRGGWLHERLA